MAKGGRNAYNLGLAADLAGALDEVFIRAELGKTHGAASVETVGADADLGAETEFEAIIEAGGRVPEDGGAVDFGEEAPGDGFVRGHDRVAVAGAIAVDDGDGLLEGIDNADGDDVVEKLGGVVRLCCRDEGG